MYYRGKLLAVGHKLYFFKGHVEDIKSIMGQNSEYVKPILIIGSDDGDDYSQRLKGTIEYYGI